MGLDKMSPDMRKLVSRNLEQLKKVFIAYCCFGELEPLMSLNSENYRKLLLDMGVIRSEIFGASDHYKGGSNV